MNTLFITLTPVIAVFGTAWYAWNYGVTWLELANFALMFSLTGMGVTAGYHRYFAHLTYDCSKPLQLFYLVFGAAAIENSVLNWASDHRYHHRYVDKDEDPYDILKGGLYAHMGWIFYKDTRAVHQKYKNVPDLLKNPMIVWQDKYYLPLVLVVSFVLPTLIGLAQGRPMGGLLWGGFLRIVIVHHMTFFVNSIAHLWGTRPYSTDNTARDNWLLGPFTFGEGYHNFHHAFQADYRNGIKWYQFDVTKWWLHAMKWMGLVSRLKKTPDSLILAARLEVEVRSVEEKLVAAGAPERMLPKVRFRLEAGRTRLETAMAQYNHAKLEYRRMKRQWSVDMRRQWRAKMDEYKVEFHQAHERWQDTMKAMNRIPHPSAQGLLTFTAIVDIFKAKLF
ncbi:MAG: fatty acid desaturase [Elusimicrobia bacterium]|nr:fatty acid desaturase [Elusimicrobiota bacterium]